MERFDLRSLYDEVILGDAVDLTNDPKVRFDLVIIGDCIEHMRKSDGVDLLNFLMYRSGYICVTYIRKPIFRTIGTAMRRRPIYRPGVRPISATGSTLHHSWDETHLFLIKGYQPPALVLTITGWSLPGSLRRRRHALQRLGNSGLTAVHGSTGWPPMASKTPLCGGASPGARDFDSGQDDGATVLVDSLTVSQ